MPWRCRVIIACGLVRDGDKETNRDLNRDHMDAAPSTAVFLQDACLHHKYIRTRDSSHIFERPERLRAVKIGLCAAISRLEETHPISTNTSEGAISSDTDSLIAAIENLKLEQAPTDSLRPKGHPVQLVQSSAKVDILRDSAVKYIHGDVDGDAYLEKLSEWTRLSIDKVSTGQSEIPSELPQGDLYCNFIFPSDTLFAGSYLANSVSDFVGRHPRGLGYGM
jgi:histone deacetylase HOS3